MVVDGGFWCILEFKDLSVADECLVVHVVVMRHGEGLEWGVKMKRIIFLTSVLLWNQD